MENPEAIISTLGLGDWFIILDLQNACFHVAVHLSHRYFLQFIVGKDHYQYRVLPFSLLTTPKVFEKVLSVVVAHL